MNVRTYTVTRSATTRKYVQRAHHGKLPLSYTGFTLSILIPWERRDRGPNSDRLKAVKILGRGMRPHVQLR